MQDLPQQIFAGKKKDITNFWLANFELACFLILSSLASIMSKQWNDSSFNGKNVWFFFWSNNNQESFRKKKIFNIRTVCDYLIRWFAEQPASWMSKS